MRQTSAGSFISDDVAWAPADFHAGLSFRSGWIVVRPDWVAFLPSAPSTHLIGAMVCAVAGFARIERGTLAYDFAAVSREGPMVFDQAVLEWASRGGWVLRANEGDLVHLANRAIFRADAKTFILCAARLPAPLVANWRAGRNEFDAKETAKLFAAITAVPAVLGAVGGIVAFLGGESIAMIGVGVGFWWSLVLLGWVGYFVAYRRSKRAAE
jgi:hypothetical protein